MEKEYLPLGTVITLKNGTKKIMISGRMQREAKTGHVYDYCAVLWPEGMIDSNKMYLFDHDDIDLLYHIGLQNQEEFNYRFVLDEHADSVHKQADLA